QVSQGLLAHRVLQSTEQIEQVFQIKGVLEGYAARLSIDYLSQQVFDGLYTQNKKMRAAFEAGNVHEYSELNVNFHLMMYDCIPQKELVNMIRDLWKKWAITKAIFQLVPTRAQSSIEEHEKILELAKGKKYDELEFYVRQHKLKSGKEFIDSLRLATSDTDNKYRLREE
ncbi:MAG: GntR family transcriptional regulator, partial [Clostridiales bacterium]|nr:GntR family transcriptional regulator [Clostridiales bacterium]